MRPALALAAALVFASACKTLPVAQRSAVPLGPGDGELYVYLGSAEDARLSLTASSVVAIATDGTRVPLEVSPARAGVDAARARDRLIARGVVPARGYAGVEVEIAEAAILPAEGGRPSALAPPSGPLALRRAFGVAPRQATVVRLRSQGDPASEAMEFAAVLELVVAERPAQANVAYVSHPELDRLTLIDKGNRTVVAVVPTGSGPHGVAVDSRRSQTHVALAGEDEILVLDSATGAPSGRVELSPRDAPTYVALTPDGRTLLVLDREADAVSFVDAQTRIEEARVTVREDPVTLLLDGSGKRAYVLTQRPPAITVLDVAGEAIAATVPLDAEPVWADFDRAGRRLYVLHEGSPHVTILSLPDLTISSRMFVGGGASRLEVDPRTDLVYVARGDAPVLESYDPLSLLALDSIRLPAPASVLAIDDVENTMWAVGGDPAVIALVDLTTGTVVSVIDLPGPVFDLSMVGER